MADVLVSSHAAVQVGSRLSPAGGVAILSADLTRPLASTDKALILQALLDHHIVVIRDQALSAEQQRSFTTNFGELEEHVARHHDALRNRAFGDELDRDGKPTGTVPF